jgi:hypothetical protein
MGMSMRVTGFRPPDDKWRQMYRIWKACTEANIEPPDEVQEFFNWSEPDPQGVEVDVPHSEYTNEAVLSHGLEVDVQQIPNGVRVLRFRVSY